MADQVTAFLVLRAETRLVFDCQWEGCCSGLTRAAIRMTGSVSIELWMMDRFLQAFQKYALPGPLNVITTYSCRFQLLLSFSSCEKGSPLSARCAVFANGGVLLA